jgi:actin-like ATPase involved in cell morphogenesis
MARAKPELRPSGIASGLRLLGGRSKLAGLDKFLLGMPANFKSVSEYLPRNIDPVEMSRETH